MTSISSQRPIMPRPAFPPTPAPSTDITGQSSAKAGQFDNSFSLPPAAIASSSRRSTETSPAASNSSSSSSSSSASDSSYHPPLSSPAVITKNAPNSRKRSSTGQVITPSDYSLPPPPTRSRKIIQMKPKEAHEQPKSSTPATGTTKAAPANGAAGKKKQAGGTTASRRIARKTAHSLIERRRRSKMNEEFGVLKDMIPACAGQEMHKLAILQASIEYMRYLQQCVDDLKEANRSSKVLQPGTASRPNEQTPPFEPSRQAEEDGDGEESNKDDDDDEDMSDAVSPKDTRAAPPQQTYQFTNPSPALYPSDRSVHSTTTSPNLYPNDVRNYAAAMSPALQPSDPHHYTFGGSSIRSTVTSPSIQPSPAFGGQTPSQPFHSPFATARSNHNSISAPSVANFALISPALGPQPDREDHEATEALLMLNTDRRSWHGERVAGGRGMSVKDLLSG